MMVITKTNSNVSVEATLVQDFVVVVVVSSRFAHLRLIVHARPSHDIARQISHRPG